MRQHFRAESLLFRNWSTIVSVVCSAFQGQVICRQNSLQTDRLGFALCNQVIHNQIDKSNFEPGFFGIGRTVYQVQNRILYFWIFIVTGGV